MLHAHVKVKSIKQRDREEGLAIEVVRDKDMVVDVATLLRGDL